MNVLLTRVRAASALLAAYLGLIGLETISFEGREVSHESPCSFFYPMQCKDLTRSLAGLMSRPLASSPHPREDPVCARQKASGLELRTPYHATKHGRQNSRAKLSEWLFTAYHNSESQASSHMYRQQPKLLLEQELTFSTWTLLITLTSRVISTLITSRPEAAVQSHYVSCGGPCALRRAEHNWLLRFLRFVHFCQIQNPCN